MHAYLRVSMRITDEKVCIAYLRVSMRVLYTSMVYTRSYPLFFGVIVLACESQRCAACQSQR